MSPSVVQGRPFCGGLEWSKANFGRAGPGPRWDLAWRSANLEKFRLRRSFARGPAPSTPVLEESLDFEARRGKKEGFFYPHFIWSYVVQCWSYVASPTPSKMVQCASKCEIAALARSGELYAGATRQTRTAGLNHYCTFFSHCLTNLRSSPFALHSALCTNPAYLCTQAIVNGGPPNESSAPHRSRSRPGRPRPGCMLRRRPATSL